MHPPNNGKTVGLLWIGLTAGVFIWSAISPRDLLTWGLETAPVVVGAIVLLLTRARFPLTRLAYVLIAVHMIILCVGGHYTYAEVPIGHWVKEIFGFARNHYDRVGHFAQGFVPALLTREILIRKEVVHSRGWLFFVVTCVCLAISASYELIEWGTALGAGAKSEAFLGTQGDPWDTQNDMWMALVGAVTAQLTLSRRHDRELESLRIRAKA
jgi:putative membrane protein